MSDHHVQASPHGGLGVQNQGHTGLHKGGPVSRLDQETILTGGG